MVVRDVPGEVRKKEEAPQHLVVFRYNITNLLINATGKRKIHKDFYLH